MLYHLRFAKAHSFILAVVISLASVVVAEDAPPASDSPKTTTPNKNCKLGPTYCIKPRAHNGTVWAARANSNSGNAVTTPIRNVRANVVRSPVSYAPLTPSHTR